MVTTANGALTNPTTGNAVYDLFALIGSARDMDESSIIKMFRTAFAQNKDLAVRTLLWARDIRGGAGERRVFRVIFQWLANNEPEVAELIAPIVPEIGRFDDLFVAMGTKAEAAAFNVWLYAIKSGNPLAAKWTPRRGEIHNKLVKLTGFTPRNFRRGISQLTNVVEQLMCANQWDKIEYAKLPSLAATRYQNAFSKHDEDGYDKYINALQKGEAKVNASAIFPHDVLNGKVDEVVNAQWNALPDYIPKGVNILPMIDVSGSMGSMSDSRLNPIKVAVTLGIYCSQRLDGAWKDKWMTYSSHPSLKTLPQGNIKQIISKVSSDTDWGMSTNFLGAMELVQTMCDTEGAKIPEYLLVLSDMEFDDCTKSSGKRTNWELIKEKFPNCPRVVFWNLNGRPGNNPVTVLDNGTIAISGFSPALLSTVLSGDIKDYDPVKVMLEVLNNQRYNWG